MTRDEQQAPPGGRHAQLLAAAMQHIPQAMRERKQWLVWKFVKKADAKKPSKMPYYAKTGFLRGWPKDQPRDANGRLIKNEHNKCVPTEEHPEVHQGHELDREALATFDEVLAIMARTARWDGIGFAFLPGDGLIGIDVDGAIDKDTGEMSAQCTEIIERCASYTELSPSGTGVHVIVETSEDIKTFKNNDVGIEVFCGRQFFTVTARPCGANDQVQPISAEALAWLHKQVKGDKPQQQALAAPAPNAYQAAKEHESRYCMTALQSAIQRMRHAGPGKRNDTLNAEGYGLAQLIHTGCINEWMIRGALGDAAAAAGLDKAEIDATLGSALRAGQDSPRQVPEPKNKGRLLSVVKPPEPPPEGDLRKAPPQALGGDEPPPHTDDEEVRPRAAAGGRRARSGDDDDEDDGFGAERTKYLLENFALIYGTDTVWDADKRRVIKISNMAHAWGNKWVRKWKASAARWTVLPEQIVFDPTMQAADENCINLYDGFALEPLESGLEDVEPILDLLRHLCSETSGHGVATTPDDVMHWVLCWLALPLQKPGAKLASALVFHGPQGTGKNMFFDVMAKIYGKYARMIGQTEIEEKYNEWLSAKLLILANEVVSRQELYHNKNKLKWIITEKEVPIRSMFQDVRWESNHAQLVFNSNESQPVVLEPDDRRFLVVYTPQANNPDLYKRVLAFMAHDGPRMFMHYLLNYDIGDFDEHTKPPMTAAKAELIELSMRPAERFMHEWLNGFLPLPMRVCSAEQLYKAATRWADQSREKYLPPRAQFTAMAKRFVKERLELDPAGQRMPPALTYKIVALDDHTGARRSARCWIPRGCGAPDGQTEGQWAHESIEAFAAVLSRFGRANDTEDLDA